MTESAVTETTKVVRTFVMYAPSKVTAEYVPSTGEFYFWDAGSDAAVKIGSTQLKDLLALVDK